MNVHATGGAEPASNLTPKLGTISLPVVGMTCASCVLAAGAIAMSSVFVLGNALRLKRFRAPTVDVSR